MSSSPAWQAAQKNFKWILRRPKRAAPRIARWNIVRGDLVQVVEGPDKGRQGIVAKVLRATNRLLVEGVNMKKRFTKPSPGSGEPGATVTRPGPVHYSNVALVDPVTKQPTKVTRRFLEDGAKARVARGSGALVARPETLRAPRLRNNEVGPKDTAPDDVLEQTFDGIRISADEIEALRASGAAAARGDGRRA